MAGEVVLIQGEGLGSGDVALGKMLMANFLRLLGEAEQKPEKIIFWNGGVKLVCEGSPVIEHLQKLAAGSVEILACTTCLEYFGLKEKQMIGNPTTMVKSIQSMMNENIVTL